MNNKNYDVDMHSICSGPSSSPSQQLSNPFGNYRTTGFCQEVDTHTIFYGIIKAHQLGLDWFSELNQAKSQLLGELEGRKLYESFRYSRSLGSKAELRRLIVSGQDKPFLIRFLADFFRLTIVCISQFNDVRFYHARNTISRYRDVLVFKEIVAMQYALCYQSLPTKRHKTRMTIGDVRDLYQYWIEKTDDPVPVGGEPAPVSPVSQPQAKRSNMAKLKWAELSVLAEKHGVASMVATKDNKRKKKRRKSDIIADLLDAGVSSQDI